MPQKLRGRRLFYAFYFGFLFVAVPGPGAQIVAVGKGSYAATLPSGRKLPADSNGIPVDPQVTPDFKQPVTTNEWWSSFLYKRVPNQHGNSGKSYPHPLSIRGAPTGLELGYPDKATKGMDWEWEWAGGTYEFPHAADLIVGIESLNTPISRTAGYSDWAVTADWTQGAMNLRATLAHGNPYAFLSVKGGNAKVTFAAAPTVWIEDGGVLGVTVNGHHYGIFAPSGSVWTGTGNARISSLAGKDYLSIGLLPDGLTDDAARKSALALFRAHAYAFVLRTRASWAYDEKLARVTTILTSETLAKEGTENRTLQAMYRHQWLHSPTPATAHTYASPRGLMRLMEGNVVTTILSFHGILPNFPDTGYDKAVLQGFLTAESGYNISDGDTYGAGKSLGRAALLVPVAEQAGNAALRDALLAKLKAKLQAWFTAAPGKTGQVFHYNAKWNILFGYPASFHSDDEVNDHHFHYGYFILAAAAVARYDPAWASAQEWGGMVDLLIRDVANADDADTRFARLRNFDPYAGHSWAHGSEYYGRGNNQESSSEAMNFHTGLFLWALATGNKALRDQAIWMYANEAEAVQQYWFDAEDAVFPELYPNPNVGQVLSAGGSYWTFFGAEANWIHGINFLPLNTGSTYLGWYPANIKGNVAWMYDHPYRFKGKTGSWDDVIWGALAFADPADAARRFGGFGGYGAFDGESKAHIYHLVKNLEAMGTVQRGVLADAPSYAVFDKAGTRTYAAYNPEAVPRTVLFNDGTTLSVGPRALASSTGPAKALRLNRGRSAARRGPAGRMITGLQGLRRAAAGVPAFSVLAVDGHEVWNSQAGALPATGLPAGGFFILKRGKAEVGDVAEE